MGWNVAECSRTVVGVRIPAIVITRSGHRDHLRGRSEATLSMCGSSNRPRSPRTAGFASPPVSRPGVNSPRPHATRHATVATGGTLGEPAATISTWSLGQYMDRFDRDPEPNGLWSVATALGRGAGIELSPVPDLRERYGALRWSPRPQLDAEPRRPPQLSCGIGDRARRRY